MDVERFLAELRADPRYAQQIVAEHRLPARRARRATLDPPLPPPLAEALARQGLDQLYTHQVETIDAARAGRDVVVVTGTASGKTLGYNLPVLERLLAEPRARALYLFPLKALAADQERKLLDFGLWQQVRVATYDGDTPVPERRGVRAHAHIVLTNPDMLHVGILPRHDLWTDFLANLRFVILDELHTYRGVFGSHVALVLRRLLRLCERYGSAPTFLASSATIGNPLDLVRQLTGRDDWTVVDRNGAPAGPKHVVVWNPPLVDPLNGARRSGNIEATWLLARLAAAGVRTLAFAAARQEAELVLRYLQAALAADSPALSGRVAAYRAGYLAGERRQLEERLATGDLTAVVATVALEAGIDIGGLDAVVMVGYPGTMAGFWQQAGRAGRRGAGSLAVMVARESLIDQYYARSAHALWSTPTEQARLDPGNVYILGGHLLCAAYETPLTTADLARFGEEAEPLLPLLCEEGYLRESGGRWLFVSGAFPAREVSLRSAANDRYTLCDTRRGAVLESDDGSHVWDRYYPGAIHLHQGEQYLVTAVETAPRQVRLEPVEVNYYTQPIVSVEVSVASVSQELRRGSVTVCSGEVTVTRQTIGLRQVQSQSRELLGTEDLDCPATTLETVALWLTLDLELRARLLAQGLDVVGALHAVEHALAAALPLVALCDVRDVQGATSAAHHELGQPASFLYDTIPGGVGLVERGFEALDELWRTTLTAVAECPCETGCPACVQLGFCGSGNWPLDKQGALAILWAGTDVARGEG